MAILLLSGAEAVAQRQRPSCFDGTSRTTSVGQELAIHFTNPALANKTVSIIAADNLGHEQSVKIKLDSKGRGSRKIPTPDWDVIILEHPSSRDYGVLVVLPGGGG